MMLSEHFHLDEFTHSQTADRLGIDNTPDANVLANLHTLAYGMEDVRKLLGGLPITISSGYRNLALNAAVGSRSSSQHIKGEACDFTCPSYGPPSKIVAAIFASTIPYDQLILEYANTGGGWVHISFKAINNAREALIIDRSGARRYA